MMEEEIDFEEFKTLVRYRRKINVIAPIKKKAYIILGAYKFILPNTNKRNIFEYVQSGQKQ